MNVGSLRTFWLAVRVLGLTALCSPAALAIAWRGFPAQERVVQYWARHHPELKDAQISRLVGTTKATIEQIRERKHWNIAQLTPMDPVALGLCSQIDLDIEVQRASRGREAAPAVGDTLLPASLTERLTPQQAAPKDEEQELDANAVFAKLSALKSKQPEDEDEDKF